MEYIRIDTIVGIVVTAIVSIGISAYYYSRRRYLGGLTFIYEESIDLFDELVKSLNDIQVNYKGEVISESMGLINGAIVNDGKIDIDKSMVAEPLSFILPDGKKWLEVTVVSSSPGVNAAMTIVDDQRAQLTTDLFRCGEVVRFRALVEVPATSGEAEPTSSALKNLVEKDLLFHHRIKNTNKVRRRDVEPNNKARQRFKRSQKLLMLPLIATIFLGISLIFMAEEMTQKLVFRCKTATNKTELCKAMPLYGDKIQLKGMYSSYKKKVSPAEFARVCGEKPIIVEYKVPVIIFALVFVGFLAFCLFILATEFLEFRRNRTINRMLVLESGLDELANNSGLESAHEHEVDGDEENPDAR